MAFTPNIQPFQRFGLLPNRRRRSALFSTYPMFARPERSDAPASQAARFGTTQWSVVLKAGQGAEEALLKLCKIYWPPLYSFVRRRGHATRWTRLPDGSVHLCFSAQSGFGFRVEASADLRDWDTVFTTMSVDDVLHFVEDDTGAFPLRFYRIVPEP